MTSQRHQRPADTAAGPRRDGRPFSRLRPAALAAVAAAALYASTLMTVVSGCSVEYCVDAGEFQVALPLWGTVHATGYPLYMALGSPFVALLRGLGVSPAAGASLFSLAWQVLAVAGLAWTGAALTGSPWLGLGAGLLFAVIEPVWVHAILPEVYSLNMAVTVAILAVAARLAARWSDRSGWLLALLAGAGVAHHRLVAVTLPAVVLYLLPIVWRQARSWRWLAGAAACFVLGFLPYLDLPLRARGAAGWNYGQPDTWDGFWYVFLGREAGGQQLPLTGLAALSAAAAEVGRVLRTTLTLPGLLLAAAASALALWRQPRSAPAWLLAAVAGSYVIFGIVFRRAVLLEAELMAAHLALALLVALGASRLGAPARRWAPVVLLVWAGFLTWRNYPFVAGLARNRSSVEYIDLVSRLEAPPGAVVMAPWSPRYFALAYARLVEGRLAGWQVVDHRADFAALAQAQGSIYTAAETLYAFGPDWWAARLGRPLRLSSAGPGLVRLSAAPLPEPQAEPLPIGDGLALAGWRVAPDVGAGTLHVVLEWVALERPARDYSTFVHAADQPEIQAPEELLAQSDASVPVYGWYPTTHWPLGEVVREDHVLGVPSGRVVTTIFAGMYRRDENGAFVQLGRVVFALGNDGRWGLRP
jgi:hypothetical protein